MVRRQAHTLTQSSDVLRDDLHSIIRAGIGAVNPARLVTEALASVPLSAPLSVLAIGKAAVPLAVGVEGCLGGLVQRGLTLGPGESMGLARYSHVRGSHPVPDQASEQAGRAALAFASATPADATLLVLLSGGASALMAVPAEGLQLDDKRATTRLLLAAGADIHELNTVRKHLSAVKGGRLALATPGRSITLAISDVVGDDLSVIGSGPTVPDPSTYADALDVIYRFGGAGRYPARVIAHLLEGHRGRMTETPKPGEGHLAHHEARVIGGRGEAMRGAAAAAAALGYDVTVIEAPVVGEARDAGRRLVREALAMAAGRGPVCVIWSGETTVRVTGRGTGGRNQECALASLAELPGAGAAFASVGTDGIDGPTSAAGAMVDAGTLERARQAGLGPADAYLDDNNSHEYFSATGDLVTTGPTGTNVGDLQVFLSV